MLNFQKPFEKVTAPNQESVQRKHLNRSLTFPNKVFPKSCSYYVNSHI